MKVWLMISVVMAAAVIALPSFSSGNNCEYSKDIAREVSLGDLMKLDVIAGAGALGIKGRERRDGVLIKATLCAQSESQLAEMDVSSKLKAGSMQIETEFSKKKFLGFGVSHAHINLELYVPANALLEVVDSSGSASVEGVTSLVMEDSSGELIIRSVAGDVRVKDSSGALRIGSVGGSVWVSDSSGGIKVANVTGGFTVEVDGSGSIEAKDIQGDVLVLADSSGAINVRDIGGDFKVGRDSSGGIRYKNVAGKVSLPN